MATLLPVGIGRSLLPQRLKEAGKTQLDLAKYLGVSQPIISEYANTKRIMSLETATNVSRFLGCGTYDLYTWETKTLR